MKARLVALVLATCLVVAVPAAADFVTPGNGSRLSLDHLVAQSIGGVTGSDGDYVFHTSVIVSVSDTLDILPGTQILFDDTTGVDQLDINGCLLALGTEAEPILFTSAGATPGDWYGIQFHNTGAGSGFRLHHATVEYADSAIDVFGASPEVENCLIRYSSEKAVDISDGGGVFRNCVVRDNQRATFSITLSSTSLIEGCLIENNNLQNSSPLPFFNIGVQGVNSPTIRNNHIIGGSEMSGGIGVRYDSAALIEGNTIEGCGYGVLCLSDGANPTIRGNTIMDNNIHPDTVLWGFGIACNGLNSPTIAANRISGHWYGVALINGATPSVGNIENGNLDDDGENEFLGNGLDGQMFELYNNTSGPIMAQNNWWGTADAQEVEDRIYHSVDELGLGTVTYTPFLMAPVSAVQEGVPGILVGGAVWPNPFNPQVNLRFGLGHDSRLRVGIYDVAGRLVRRLVDEQRRAGEQALLWNGRDGGGRAQSSGVYFYRIEAGGERLTGKLVLAK